MSDKPEGFEFQMIGGHRIKTGVPAEKQCDDAEVMRIWRECGLPEFFLGNGGTNDKLVEFAKRTAGAALAEAQNSIAQLQICVENKNYQLDGRAEQLRIANEENARLRGTLIAVGRKMGCLLADEVSTEFL